MSSNVVLFGWDQPIPGREQISAAHFQDFMAYLGNLQESGSIGSWEVVFLNPHGGDLNGFFLIKGEPDQISDLIASEDWVRHMTRATLHLHDPGAVAGATGDLITDRFGMWSSLIPE